MSREFILPQIINKDSLVPIYKQITNWIKSQITTGEWPTNFKLPSEIDFANDIGVSRGSLRKAIELLVDEQLLVQIHGKGTYVKGLVFDKLHNDQQIGVTNEVLCTNVKITTQVIEQRIISPPLSREIDVLGLDGKSKVLVIKQMQLIKDMPIVFSESYLPASPFIDLMAVDFTREPLLSTLESMHGIRLMTSNRSVAAIAAIPEVANHLGVDIGDPVLYVNKIITDNKDRKVLFSKEWFRGDRVRLKSTAKRGPGDDADSFAIVVRWPV